MVPTKFVFGAIAMLPNAFAKLSRFGNQFISGHGVQISVHGRSPDAAPR
jgi:hypothetical protein